MTCPYSHYLGYELGIKSARPARPLHFGSDFHKLLQFRGDQAALEKAVHEIAEAYYELPAKWQSELGPNYLEDLQTIFSDYCKVYQGERLPTITEQEFLIPMFEHKGETYFFKGFIDELYLRKSKATGERYIKVGEHKTFTKRPDLNTLVMNPQKNLYAKAVQFLYGFLPRSVIWDYIHSKPAMEPIWLEKSKRFSTAKSAMITPFSWLRACTAREVSDPAVLDQAKQFEGNVPAFFFRVEQDYDPAAVEAVWKGFVFQARLIARYGHKNKTKHLSKNCSWCSYRDICYTELTGGNLKYLLERDFVVKPREDVVTEQRRASNGLLG